MEKNQIFARHRRMLSIQRSVLQQIFEQSYYASDLGAYAEEFVKELRLINTGGHQVSVDEIMENAIGWESIQHMEAEAREIYAGCLFVVLNDWIQSLGKTLGIKSGERLSAGPLIGNVELARLIWAAANNFKHYSEWQRTRAPEYRAKKSIDALRAAGILEPQNGLCTSVALQLIGVDNYGQLEEKVIDVGKELAAKV